MTYGPMLAQFEKNKLENFQKHCLRVIFGFDKDYETLLEESGLERLDTRRENQIKKIAKKTLQNKQFAHWFPLN